MIHYGRIALVGALICFLIFFGNVATGAAGFGVFFGDVSEMLALFASVLLFVASVLMLEAAENRIDNPRQPTHPKEDST